MNRMKLSLLVVLLVMLVVMSWDFGISVTFAQSEPPLCL